MPHPALRAKKNLKKIKRRLKSYSKQFDRELFYYKHVYRKHILSSPSFACDPNSEFEIHTIICERDLLNALWTLKSFYFFSELTPRLVIHDDGSLSAQSNEILAKHFVGCRIIQRAVADAQMQADLKGHTHLLEFRAKKGFHCALKIFDILSFSECEKLLLLDTDILFFQSPEQMIEGMKCGTPFYNGDYQSHYAKGALEFSKIKGISILPEINAGLLFLNKSFYAEQLSLMDDYFAEIVSHPAPGNINIHEQTLHAILMSKAKALRLSETYQISSTDIDQETIAHHFVNDGSRENFYSQGLKYLKELKFLEHLKAAKKLN